MNVHILEAENKPKILARTQMETEKTLPVSISLEARRIKKIRFVGMMG